jgi:hypothetical protein
VTALFVAGEQQCTSGSDTTRAGGDASQSPAGGRCIAAPRGPSSAVEVATQSLGSTALMACYAEGWLGPLNHGRIGTQLQTTARP